MRKFYSCLVVAFVLLFCSYNSEGLGQSIGDYRSNASPMNWSAANNWEMWDGAKWITALAFPGENTGTNLVTIQNSHTVTIDITPEHPVGSLTVGGGTSGILQFETIASKSLTISGDIIIAAGGVFRSTASTATVTHQLILGGNLAIGNSAQFDCLPGSNRIVNVTLNSASSSDQLISPVGSPTIVRFNRVVIDRGSSNRKIVSTTNVTVSGGTDAFGWTNGTWEQSAGTLTFTGNNIQSLTANGNLTISGTGGAHFNGTFVVSGGVFLVNTTGIVTIGGGSNRLEPAGGNISLTAGTINVGGRIGASSAPGTNNWTGAILINGATVNVPTSVLSNNTHGVFGSSSSGNFTMTAGTLNILQANQGSFTGTDLNIEGGTITGGTITIGSSSPGNKAFDVRVVPALNDIILNAGINEVKFILSNLSVNGTLTYQSSGELSGTPVILYTANGNLSYANAENAFTRTVLSKEWPVSNGPQNVTINLTGTGSPAISLSGDRTIAGTFTLTEGALHLGTNTLTLLGIVRRSNGLIEATSGKVVFQGSSDQNIPVNLFSGSINNLTIHNASGVQMNSMLTVGGTLALTTGALHLNGHTLTLNGPVSGAGTFTGSSSSNLIIGSAAGMLNFTPGSHVLKDLTLNSGASAILGSPLSIAAGNTPGKVTVNSDAVLASGGYLTLKSNAGGTASVAPSAGTITGAVTVESFIPIPATSRRYRLLTAPVKGTSINASWQEGRTFDGAAFSPSAPTPGYGTMITGQAQGSKETASTNGFDYWDAIANNVASVRFYQGALSSSAAQWRAPATTTFANAFDRQQTYLLFIRGDRTFYSGTTPGATTLRATGELKQGDTVSATLYGKAVQSHTLLGNPYAAPLEFKSLAGDNSSKMENYFWIWNAALGTATGAYAVVTPDENNGDNYEIIPNPTPTSSPANSVISSGQGFFVVPKPEQTENTTLLFKESYKAVASPGVQLFRQQRVGAPTSAKLYINLNSLSAGGEKILLDGVLAQFSSMFENSHRDIGKAANGSENLSVLKGSSNLIVASQPAPKKGDVLQLRLWNTTVRDYRFEIQGQNFSSLGVRAVLEDDFSGTQTPVSLAGDPTLVNFSITADAASKDPLRFRIVFKEPTALPLQVATLRAQEKHGKVIVSWAVENETGIQGYEVEKSADARMFHTLAAVRARGGAGAQVYETADASPFPVNYYRIKLLGITGEEKRSAVVKADGKSALASLQVYPNPVSGGLLQVQLQNRPEGLYRITLFKTTGQMVVQKQVQHAGGSQTSVLTLPSNMARGLYRLEVRNSKGGKAVMNLMVE